MKRIFIVSFLALTVALGAVATGCSGGNNSSSTDKSSSKVESVNDSSADDSSTAEVGNTVIGDFVWDENSCIVSLTKDAAKKREIVIPENCIDLRIDDWANDEDNYFLENDNLESVVAKLAYESAKHSANSTCHMVVQKYIINRRYH